MPDHQRAALATLDTLLDADERPLVLDGGCGTGDSSRDLARALPDHLVVGIDKSIHRLGRGGGGPLEPALPVLLRMDLAWTWRALAARAGRVAHQLLLYPNPWPKPGHLRRRWHGHPAFGAMLTLGGTLEVRTNWGIYAEEMRIALELAGASAVVDRWPWSPGGASVPYDPNAISTPFERKYLASGHSLWRVMASLDQAKRTQRVSSSSSTATS